MWASQLLAPELIDLQVGGNQNGLTEGWVELFWSEKTEHGEPCTNPIVYRIHEEGGFALCFVGMGLFKQNSNQVLNNFSGKMFTMLLEVTTNDNNDNT